MVSTVLFARIHVFSFSVQRPLVAPLVSGYSGAVFTVHSTEEDANQAFNLGREADARARMLQRGRHVRVPTSHVIDLSDGDDEPEEEEEAV